MTASVQREHQVPSPHPEPSVLVLVIAYEAASTIEGLLDRIPASVPGASISVLVADDASADGTAELARAWGRGTSAPAIDVVRRPANLGYGGNQAAGYRHAIDAGMDAVVVVHGDGQYPPERTAELVEPILAGDADAVFGSRMLVPGGARRGGMPLQRIVGNALLSRFQNLIVGADLSEWHTGLRAYRVDTLRRVDLDSLPPGFDFDTAITLRLLRLGARIREIPIPTRYGDEVSYIHPYRTGLRIVRHTLAHRWPASRRALAGRS